MKNIVKNEKGVTLVTMVIMIVIMTIIASVAVINGTKTVKEAQKQVKESTFISVKNAVTDFAAKKGTAGVLTPANITYPGIKNAVINGEAIGEEWYLLDESALKEMGIEYADENYVANYELGVVISLSETDNVHNEIRTYTSST